MIKILKLIPLFTIINSYQVSAVVMEFSVRMHVIIWVKDTSQIVIDLDLGKW